MEHAGENSRDARHFVEREQRAREVQHQEDDAHRHHDPREKDVLNIGAQVQQVGENWQI